MKTEAQNPIRWVDLIRVSGSFLVVMAHLGYVVSRGTYVYEFYYALSRIAVPLFFLVSGFLLLSRQESISDFFWKRAWKVFFPFLLWSIVFMAMSGDFSKSDSLLDMVYTGISKILRGPRSAHFWFLYALIGLYLATPILRVFTSHANQSDLIYFIFMWLIAVPLYGFIEHYTKIRIGFEWNMFTGYIGYFVLGYFLGRMQFTRPQLWLMIGIFLISFFVTWFGTYRARQIEPYNDYVEIYLSLNVILFAASGFVLLSRVVVSDKLHAFLLPQSRASFGVYIIHVFVLNRMMNILPFGDWYQNPSAIWVMPALAIVAYFISLIIVLIIQKIPILRYIFP